MIEMAYAKINLSLDVVERRDDGFHNVRSVMHSVSLCDELDFKFEDSEILSVDVTSNVSEIIGEDNLVCRAATIYMKRAGLKGKIGIHLQKNIPIGAGLGGGSSDAAATFRALNDHYGVFSEEELIKLCSEIGSDVSFCYRGGTALCEGRGEVITPVGFDEKLNFVIAIGDERVSTPKAYKLLDVKFSNFDGTVLKKTCEDNLKLQGTDIFVYNIFEEVICDEIESVSRIKSLLYEHGAEFALMTGSGPAVFGIFLDADAAKESVLKLKNLGIEAFFAESVL